MNTEAQPPSWRSHYRIVALIIIVGIVIRVPLLSAPLTANLTDDWRQADTASIAHHFYKNGYHIFYPQIYWGGNGPGYVETEFQLYPFTVAVLYRFFGEQVWLGRLVSLLITVVTFIVFYLLARRLIGSLAALWALGFFVISPLLIRYSVAYMPEATVLCFYVTALYFFQRWLEQSKPNLILFAALSTAAAILVKPTAIHIGLIFLLMLIEQYGWRLFNVKAVWLFGLVSLVPGILWYAHARNLYLTYGNTFGVFSGGDSKFGNFSYWLSPTFYGSLLQLDVEWVFAGVGILVFLLGAGLLIRQRHSRIVLYGVITIVIYYMIVARYASETWGIQYHIYLVPFAALGVGPGLDWLFESARSLSKRGAMLGYASILGGLIVLALIFYSSGRTSQRLLSPRNQNLANCGLQVASVVPADAKIVVSTTSRAMDNGVANNYQEPHIFFYSDRYGWSLPADWHTADYLRKYRGEGAGYFVIYNRSLYTDNPAFAAYLEQNARQIGPGIDKGCGIYQFQ